MKRTHRKKHPRRQLVSTEILEGRILLSAATPDPFMGDTDTANPHGGALLAGLTGGDQGDQGQGTIITLSNAAPTVVTPASASPSPVGGTSASLSVLGADDGGEAGLTYTWSAVGAPGPVSFSVNGTNAAKNTTATFTKASTYNFTVTIADQGGLSTLSTVSVPVSFGLFSDSADIGSPALAGSLTFNATNGTYTVRAGGVDIWDSSDQFRYTHTSFSGDGQMTARVTSVTNTDPWAKAGVMYRNGVAANAAFAMVVATPGSGVSFQWRGTAGGTPGFAQVTGINAPVWVRVVRNGNQFSGFYSLNNVTWTQIGSSQTINMPTSVQAGLALTSHNAGSLCTAVFDNVALAGPVVARGRPTLNAARTTFVGDNGQLLRGPYTSTEWTGAVPMSEMQKIKSLGFNSVHLYAEVFDANYPNPGSTAPGYAASRVDQIVQSARELGLYVVMTIGNGANNGNYNRKYIEDFWAFYAPRYANATHVLFEIQNEPVAWGPPYSSPSATPPGAVDMQISAYNIIRTHAPNTPVMLFSYAVLGDAGGANAALQDIRVFNQAVFGNTNAVWTNEAVGFHGYAGAAATAVAMQAILNAGYPMFMTEFASGIWGTGEGCIDADLVVSLEQMQVSWLTFQYIPPTGVSDDVTKPSVYKDVIERAGISWTPDYGDWPAARSPFGNGGQPRATATTYVNNQLTGTLRIQAEDFDDGGQGVAYHDADPANQGGQYRPGQGVDIAAATDAGGGFAVTSTVPGEWLEYTIRVAQPGYYVLGLRYAATAAGAVRVLAQGIDITGQLTLGSTGGLNTWATLTHPVFLGYGRQKLRVEVVAGGFNLNWIELTPQVAGPVANGVHLLVNRNSGQAMHFNTANNLVVQQPLAVGSNLQRWNLINLGAGQYRITSVHNGQNWNGPWGMNSELGIVGWWGTSGAQMFLIRPADDGYYRIAPVGTGLDYEVRNGSVTAGTSIVQSRYAGRPSQQWALLALGDQVFPTQLLAFQNSAGAPQLTWSAAAGAATYNVKRALTPGGPYTTIATGVGGTGYIDASAAPNTTYYYVVSAVGAAGNESLDSAEVGLATPRALLRFDEGTGTNAADATGNGWNGTLRNGALWASGVTGNAVFLDGVNDYVSLPTGVVNGLTDFSIALWVNLAANPTWARIFDFGTGTNVNMYLTANPNNPNSIRFAITTGGSGNEQRISGAGLTTGTWNHIVVTLSGGVGTLYVNGQIVGTNSSMTLTPSSLGATNNNFLGRSQYNDPALSGRIDDLRIYASALSGNAVASLYNAWSVPTVATAASASPAIVNGTTAQLAALGADDGGEAGLTYTWSLSGTPPAPVMFSANGSNAAKNTVATFTRAGTYDFVVSITDGKGLTVTSSVAVIVNAVPTGITVTPSPVTVTINTTRQFTAVAHDQFNAPLSPQPTFTWSVVSGGGEISSSGLYTAPGTAGSATVRAEAGSSFGIASVNITTQAAPVIAIPASATPSPAGTSTALSVRGNSSAGEASLTYTWSVVDAPGPVSFSVNGTNAAKNTTATFTRAGVYNFTVTIADQVGLSTATSITVPVSFGQFSDSIDIGSPALAGSLTFNASNGTYTVRAGGVDIWGSSDQFRYTHTSFSGNGQITARVASVTNTDVWAKAGVMYRDGVAANAAFAMVVATPGSGVSFQWRGTPGGAAGSAQVTGITAPVWVRLVRNGNQFSGFYSLNNVTWTQIGSSQTIGMASTVQAGLAFTSHNPGSLGTAVIDNVSIGAPTIATPASATPNPVAGTAASLSVLGADDGGEANLAYAWSLLDGPASVIFSVNGTNAAKSTTATFSKAGTYAFRVTITDLSGLSTISSVNVTVNQTLASITVGPADASVNSGATQQFTAMGYDQFGAPMVTPPMFAWSATGGMIDSTGLLTAGGSAGVFRVTAASGSVSGGADYTVEAVPLITGTDGPDIFVLRRDASGQDLHVYRSSTTPENLVMTWPLASPIALTIRGEGGDDVLVADFSNGAPIPAGGISFEGGSGQDVLVITGTGPADSLAIHPGQVLFGELVLASDAELVQLGQAGIGLTLGSLTLTDGAAAGLPPGGAMLLTIAELDIAAGATLDLADGGMIVNCGGPEEAEAMRALIHAWIASSRNAAGGPWTGSGITSSAAQTMDGGVTGLAMVVNNDGQGNVLVKYTRNGDVNLDGRISAADYFHLDRGLLAGGAGYANGDFNYDGRIDGDDYFLIDLAFLTQTPPHSFSAGETIVMAAPGANLFSAPDADPGESTIAPAALPQRASNPVPFAIDPATLLAGSEIGIAGSPSASPAARTDRLFGDRAVLSDEEEVWR